MSQIDHLTIKKAVNVFELMYGRFDDLGLSRHALKGFLRFGFIPDLIRRSDQKLTRELELISHEFRKILVKAMKLKRTL